MNYHLNGKVAGITGAGDNKGLGFAITRTLLQEGCSCFIMDLNETELLKRKAELSEFGEVEAYRCDISNASEVEQTIGKVMDRFGKIDIYVNNAGVCPNVSIADMSEEAWDRGMAINLKSVFLSGKIVAPRMKSGSCIINAASFVSLIPTAGLSMYSASKAGVLTLTRVMAAELGSKGIRVNCYVPGLMDTTMNAERIATQPDRLKSQIASGTFGQPQDVANAVAFLASDSASYINGTYIEVAGGKFCTQNPDYSWAAK
ncbi:MAG: SDR family oxidoreductase [Muribaculaceae bacterium]|nr:SDR family oxidoreductase [Muribaculaceae bacterium]